MPIGRGRPGRNTNFLLVSAPPSMLYVLIFFAYLRTIHVKCRISNGNHDFPRASPITAELRRTGVTCNTSLNLTLIANTTLSKDPDINADAATKRVRPFDTFIIIRTSQRSQSFNSSVDLNADGTVDSFDPSIFLSKFAAPIVQKSHPRILRSFSTPRIEY